MQEQPPQPQQPQPLMTGVPTNYPMNYDANVQVLYSMPQQQVSYPAQIQSYASIQGRQYPNYNATNPQQTMMNIPYPSGNLQPQANEPIQHGHMSQNPQSVADNILQMAVTSYPNNPTVQVPIGNSQPGNGYQISMPQFSPNSYPNSQNPAPDAQVQPPTPYNAQLTQVNVSSQYMYQQPQYVNQQPLFTSNLQPQNINQQPQYTNQQPQYTNQQPQYSNHPPQYVNQQQQIPQYTGNQPIPQMSYMNQLPQYTSTSNQQQQYTGNQHVQYPQPPYTNQQLQYTMAQHMYVNQPPLQQMTTMDNQVPTTVVPNNANVINQTIMYQNFSNIQSPNNVSPNQPQYVAQSQLPAPPVTDSTQNFNIQTTMSNNETQNQVGNIDRCPVTDSTENCNKQTTFSNNETLNQVVNKDTCVQTVNRECDNVNVSSHVNSSVSNPNNSDGTAQENNLGNIYPVSYVNKLYDEEKQTSPEQATNSNGQLMNQTEKPTDERLGNREDISDRATESEKNENSETTCADEGIETYGEFDLNLQPSLSDVTVSTTKSNVPSNDCSHVTPDTVSVLSETENRAKDSLQIETLKPQNSESDKSSDKTTTINSAKISDTPKFTLIKQKSDGLPTTTTVKTYNTVKTYGSSKVVNLVPAVSKVSKPKDMYIIYPLSSSSSNVSGYPSMSGKSTMASSTAASKSIIIRKPLIVSTVSDETYTNDSTKKTVSLLPVKNIETKISEQTENKTDTKNSNLVKVVRQNSAESLKETTASKAQPEMDSEVSSTNSNESPTRTRQRKQILIMKDVDEEDFELVTNRTTFMPFGRMKKQRTVRVMPASKFATLTNSTQVYGEGSILSRVGTEHRNIRILNDPDTRRDTNSKVMPGKRTIILDARTGIARWPKIALSSSVIDKSQVKNAVRKESTASSSSTKEKKLLSHPMITLSSLDARDDVAESHVISRNKDRSKRSLVSTIASPRNKKHRLKTYSRKKSKSPQKRGCAGVVSSVESSSKSTPKKSTTNSSSINSTKSSSETAICFNSSSTSDKIEGKADDNKKEETDDSSFICSWNSDGEEDIVMDTVDDSMVDNNGNDEVDFEPAKLDVDEENSEVNDDRTVSNKKLNDRISSIITKNTEVLNSNNQIPTKRVHRNPKKFDDCIIESDISEIFSRRRDTSRTKSISPSKRKSDVIIPKTPPSSDKKKRRLISPKSSTPKSKTIHAKQKELSKHKSPQHSDKKKTVSKKHSGPFIRMDKTAPTSSYKIVNEIHEDQVVKPNGKSAKPQVVSTMTHISNIPSDKSVLVEGSAASNNPLWFCSICKQHSSFKFLGDLYGPYCPESAAPVAQKVKKESTKNTKCTFVQAHKLTNDWLVPKHVKGKSASTMEEFWVHETCALWSADVFLLGNKVYGLKEASAASLSTTCSVCRLMGANIGCLHKGCNQKFHYMCAYETDCFLDDNNFSLRCLKHKAKRSKKPETGS